MKLKTVVLWAVVAALALPAMSMAQGGGGGGRGQGGMRMMGGGNSALQLLQRKDVGADLKLTEAQTKAIAELQAAQQEKMRARMEEMRNGGGGGFDREALQAEMQKVQKEQDEAIGKILDEKQASRLKQIQLQFQGMRAVMTEAVQKQLELTPDQKVALDKLQQSQREANQEVMQRVQNQEITREEMTSIMEKNNKILDEEIGKVLTDKQKEILKGMMGEKFNRDPKEDQNRGGRGGGGGGN